MASQHSSIITPRLELRAFAPMEAEIFAALLNDHRVTRWMPTAPKGFTVQFAQKLIEQSINEFDSNIAINLAILRQTDRSIIGEITLDLRTFELGFWLGAAFWGHGYGSEAVRAVTRMAREKYPFAVIRASVHRGNLASARLLENCGFHFAGLCWRASTSGRIPWLDYRGFQG